MINIRRSGPVASFPWILPVQPELFGWHLYQRRRLCPHRQISIDPFGNTKTGLATHQGPRIILVEAVGFEPTSERGAIETATGLVG